MNNHREPQGILRYIIAALLVVLANPAPARAQDVVKQWDCLTMSAAADSLFRAVLPAGCTVPGVEWQGFSPARAIDPPGSPSALTANVINRTVVLTWARPVNGGDASSYIVQAGSASGLSNLVSSDTESPLTTLTATNVPDGLYFFRVLARSASGSSGTSNEISVRVGNRLGFRSVVSASACTTPPASTGFTAIVVVNVSVTFVWRAGEGDCQAFALPTGYVIEYGYAPGQTAGTLTVGPQPTTVVVPVPGISGIFYVRVRGVNAAGIGVPSNEIVLVLGASCNAAPLAPTNLSSTVSGGTVVLTWDDPSPLANTPSGYRVSTADSTGKVTQLNSSSKILPLNGLPGGKYSFQVAGVNSCGVGAGSNILTVTVGGPAVPVTVLGAHSMAGAPNDGANFSSIMLGKDGNFYLTTVSGGPFNSRCVANLEGCGVIARMTPTGAWSVLATFGNVTALTAAGSLTGAAPVYPYGRLTQDGSGNFWGTLTGQENGAGSAAVYKMTPSGSVSIVTELGGPSYSNLALGPDGNFYGTTIDNGPGTCSWRSSNCTPSSGSGTVFQITLGGSLNYIKTFNGSDGSKPYAGLVLGSDGNFYGTTSAGGASGFGTIFRISTGGAFATLYSFKGGNDGANPAYSPLMQASDGNFYGTTQFGGSSVNSGTVFKMTPAGVVTILHAFTGVQVKTGEAAPTTALDGLQPGGGITQASDGNLYGVAGGGGGFAGGTAFMVTLAGVYTQLYAFDGSLVGGSPTATLVVGPDGNLWGTAQYGGTSNRGVAFRMTLPK